MADRRKASTRAEWLDALPDAYQDCRDYGHRWRPHAGGWHDAGRYWERVLRCSRCRTERVQTINAFGHVTSNRYRYADAYTAPPGGDPISRDEIRLMAITRQLGK